MALREHTRKLFLRALRQPQMGPQIVRNALALWLYLDTEYPKCEFQRSMVPISDSDEPLFGELIFEADTAGAHLLAQCSRMEANQVDSVLVKTRTVLINRDFALLLLFLNKDGSRERLLLFVTIRQNVRADLGVEPTSHQHAQIEVGHQEQHTQNKMGRQEHKRSTVDVDGRPLQIRFMKGNPSMMPFLDFYSKFGDCIETIVIEEDDPPRTGTIVLQTPEDVTRVMAGTKFNTIQPWTTVKAKDDSHVQGTAIWAKQCGLIKRS